MGNAENGECYSITCEILFSYEKWGIGNLADTWSNLVYRKPVIQARKTYQNCTSAHFLSIFHIKTMHIF